MNESSKFNARQRSGSAFDMTDMSEALGDQSNAWLNAQSSVAGAMQGMMTSWTRWRQEDAHAAIKTWQQIASSKDAASVTSAYSEWIAGVIDRRKREFESATDEAMRLATVSQQSMRSLSLNEAGRLRATGLAMADSKSTTLNTHSEAPKHEASA